MPPLARVPADTDSVTMFDDEPSIPTTPATPDASVLHVTDLHLDQGRWGRTNPDTGVSLAWESADRCWQFACDWAIENRPDVFMFTGDAFANGRPSAEAQERFAGGVRRVAAAGIPVVLERGNHELIGVPGRHRDVLARYEDIEGVRVVTRPELVVLDSGLQIACVPWPRRHELLQGIDLTGLDPEQIDALVSSTMVTIVDELADQIDETRGPAMLAGHFTVSTATLGTDRRGSETVIAALFNEPIVPIGLVSDDPWSYVALGHIHKFQQVSDRGWYAGSPDRIDFSEEDDPKGFIVANLFQGRDDEDGGPVAVDFVDTPARVMKTLRVADAPSLDVLEEGMLVRIVLPDGEKTAPPEYTLAVKEAGAVLMKVDTRPARHQKRSGSGTVDVDTPVLDALTAWMDRTETPDSERGILVDAAKVLIDQASG